MASVSQVEDRIKFLKGLVDNGTEAVKYLAGMEHTHTRDIYYENIVQQLVVEVRREMDDLQLCLDRVNVPIMSREEIAKYYETH